MPSRVPAILRTQPSRGLKGKAPMRSVLCTVGAAHPHQIHTIDISQHPAGHSDAQGANGRMQECLHKAAVDNPGRSENSAG